MKAKIAAAALMLVTATSAFAAGKDQSVSIFGNYSQASGADGGNGFASASYGFMLTESLELELTVGASFTSSGNTSSTSTTVGGAGKYYFGSFGKSGAMVPYVKADWIHLEDLDVYGGGAGIDYGLSESASVFAEVLAHKSNSGGSDTITQVNVGLKFRF